MNDRFSIPSLIWGAVLTLVGVAVTGTGAGWWDLSLVDFRWLGPVLVILAGLGIVAGAVASNRDRS